MRIVITGIKLEKPEELKPAWDSGFRTLEVSSFLLSEILAQPTGSRLRQAHMTGISARAAGLTSSALCQLLLRAAAAGIPYVVVETEQLGDKEGFRNLLERAADAAINTGVHICIENGYRLENGHYRRNGLCSGEELVELIDSLNQKVGSECFEAALNTGHANLMGNNIRGMMETLGRRIKVIHVNDNDGIGDLHQMPYTFTVGRGALQTDWYGFVRALIKLRYDGQLLFDVGGLLNNTPAAVLPAMMKLLYAIGAEWEQQIGLEKRLRRNQTRILFGAGNMFRNYMNTWGRKYPPAFVVDNNPGLWGKSLYDIEIKPPEAILAVPEDERDVWICNMSHLQIIGQLAQMGIRGACLDDRYFAEAENRDA